LIADAIALGRDPTRDRSAVERGRLNVLALSVPEAEWLTTAQA
jgi:hypothetical protein